MELFIKICSILEVIFGLIGLGSCIMLLVFGRVTRPLAVVIFMCLVLII